MTIASLVAAGAAQSSTWFVPDDFVTIQAAVDFSASGDTVLVRPGTYVETVLLLGKSLRIASLAGPATTTIDGSAPTRPDTLSVLCAIGPLELDLEGLTIRSGLGGTTIEGGGGDSGGGIALYGVDGRLRDCVVEHNFCPGSGGGIYLVGSSVTIADCLIRDNECFSNGGGIDAVVSSPTIERCMVVNNGTESTNSGGGIGVYFGSPVIRDCEITGNRGRSGSGLGFEGTSSPTITRCLIAGNSNGVDNQSVGGGISVGEGGARIEQCTIVGNRGYLGAGVLASGPTTARVTRSIIAFNLGGPGVSCPGTVTFECCDVFGNEDGDDICGTDLGSNFSLDPFFCADYSLAESSPCAPANAPAGCGLIGARDVGCAGAVEESTWGAIKMHYGR